ncbi:internal scaffolding protein [Microviridae sp.]|nr:internal scaffolding protein [Microviridae sp.]
MDIKHSHYSLTNPTRERVQVYFDPDTKMTEQAHADEVKIQNILRKYRDRGVVQHVAVHKGTYMDMIDAPDYQEAQNQIAAAKSLFETVPSHIRKDFENNPSKFIEFMQNPNNREAIEAYGLDSSHLPSNEPKSTPTPNPKKAKKSPQSVPEPSQDDKQPAEAD